MTYFHEGMKCAVNRISYDFNMKVGTVEMPVNNCTDMSGCIATFTQLDPKVKYIQTFAGGHLDTVYRLREGTWEARLP